MIDWLRREALEPTIKLIGRDVPIDLVRNRRAKRLTLRLALDGSAVRITLPHWCRSADAIAFAHARQEWLSAQLAKVPERRDPARDGRMLYRGEDIAIEWREDLPRKPDFKDGAFRVGGPRETLGARLQRWLEREAFQPGPRY